MNSLTVRYRPSELHALMFVYNRAAQSLADIELNKGQDICMLVYLVLKDLRMRIAKRIDSGAPIKSFTYSAEEVMAIHWGIRNNWIEADGALTQALILELNQKIKQGYNV